VAKAEKASLLSTGDVTAFARGHTVKHGSHLIGYDKSRVRIQDMGHGNTLHFLSGPARLKNIHIHRA